MARERVWTLGKSRSPEWFLVPRNGNDLTLDAATAILAEGRSFGKCREGLVETHRSQSFAPFALFCGQLENGRKV